MTNNGQTVAVVKNLWCRTNKDNQHWWPDQTAGRSCIQADDDDDDEVDKDADEDDGVEEEEEIDADDDCGAN